MNVRTGTIVSVKRQRRKADVGRALIIAAARELFAERGYARTTTRDIAARANSSEVLLFRYFQNKANLFREAVVIPFDEFLKTFLDAQSATPGDEPFAGSQEFIDRLFHALSDHREILFALISTRLYETGEPEEQVNAAGFDEYFRTAMGRIEDELKVMGVTPTISPAISSRMSFTMVMATALFHKWIFAGTNIGATEVITALNEFIVAGMTGTDHRRQETADDGLMWENQ